MSSTAGGRAALAGSFAGAARRYWLGVFPRVCAERRRREARAQEIPDQMLRQVVVDALRKWGNIEGASAFAAFVPRRHRAAAARAMVCFQAAYNYLDMLSELPNTDPVANGRLLHRALLVALDPGAGAPRLLRPPPSAARTAATSGRRWTAAARRSRSCPPTRRSRPRRCARRSGSWPSRAATPARCRATTWRSNGGRGRTPRRDRHALVGDRGRRGQLAGYLRADRGGGRAARGPR